VTTSLGHSLLVSIICSTIWLTQFGPAPAEPDHEARLLTRIHQVTFAGRRAGEGYFSADGTRMIFQSEREPDNPFYQIYLLDLETGDSTRVSPGIGKTTCAWIHPQAPKVLFASTHTDPQARAKQQEELAQRASGQTRRYAWDFDEHYEIFEANSQGGQLTNLTHALGYDAEGSWSPDGTWIVFASNRHAYTTSLSDADRAILARDPSYFVDLYLMRADGTRVQRLTQAPGYDGGPFFSPDGRKIVWRHFAPDGATAEIWTMNLDGAQQQQITHLGVMSWAPYFHPSGAYIIFTNNSQGFGNFELFIVDSAGQHEPVRVTSTDGFDGLPVFSPDGQRLAWTSTRTPDRTAQIFMADWNDTEARALLGLTGAESRSATAPPAAPPSVPDLRQTSPTITPADIRLHIGYLASEALGGRFTGSEGERLATDYVARVFGALGLQPAGDHGTFFQSFPFTAGVSLDATNVLTLHTAQGDRTLTVESDWRPLAFSHTGAMDAAGVVFAGYGIVAPTAGQFPAYDAYANLDVTDKWVLLLRYMPENITPEHRQHLAAYASLPYKTMLARDHGARGILLVSGPNSQVTQQLVPLTFDSALAGASIGALSITDAVADELLHSAGKTLQGLQDALDSGAPVPGVPLPDVTLTAVIGLQQERRTGRNVLARLPVAARPTESLVVLGAHIDHLGQEASFNSRAHTEEQGQVHPGADDNASGVAGILEIAQYVTDLHARGQLAGQRDVLFAAWSGEELGLLGSGYFVRTFRHNGQTPATLTPYIAAYLNFDMIGRLTTQVYLHGVGSSSVWPGVIERSNVAVGLPIVMQLDSYLPTDSTSFYLKGVPILNAFTGPHADYHTPRDTAERINTAGAASIAQFMAGLTRTLVMRPTAPDYIAQEKPTGSGSRANLRAYLGTIPEYGDTAEIKGVKLQGVARGGPAAQAGLQADDVIVHLAGKTIENIYDYTHALQAVKVGQPITVEVLRNGQRATFTVTPTSRD
jgi:Tol biopolymer transport system component